MSKLAVLGVALIALLLAATEGAAQANNEERMAAYFETLFRQQLRTPPVILRNARHASRSCSSMQGLALAPNASIIDAHDMPGQAGNAWCRLTVAVRHPPAPNLTTVWIGLPVTHWNGRFLGLGGAEFMAGHAFLLPPAVGSGFAAASTDAGHKIETGAASTLSSSGAFVRDVSGRLDRQAVRNFAYLGIHDMTVVGKAATSAYYGVAPAYSYFSGCSTGGRQGQAEVQRYPRDYDGVLSGSPVLNLPQILMRSLWPVAVMNDRGAVGRCKFAAARQARLAVCDPADGLRDGIIADPSHCRFDPAVLVGRQTECGPISERDAAIISEIWSGARRADGARLYYGTAEEMAGPSAVALTWVRYFLGKGDQWTPDRLTRAEFVQFLRQSIEQFGDVLATVNPDLSQFAAAGGRTILWQGLNDTLPEQGIADYVHAVRARTGATASDAFLRYYRYPGVGHCGGGPGTQPAGLLTSLMAWVEDGSAPPMAATH